MALKMINNMAAITNEIDLRSNRAVYAALTSLDAVQATNIPIDTSALANNRTIQINSISGKTTGRIMFMQGYAAAVQAMVGVRWKRPDAKDQWLTYSVQEAKADIDATVYGVMRL